MYVNDAALWYMYVNVNILDEITRNQFVTWKKKISTDQYKKFIFEEHTLYFIHVT